MLAQKPEVMQCRNNCYKDVCNSWRTELCHRSAFSHPDSLFALVFTLNEHKFKTKISPYHLSNTGSFIFFLLRYIPLSLTFTNAYTFVLNDSTFIYRRNTERWFNIVGATLPVFKSQLCHLYNIGQVTWLLCASFFS